MEQMLKSTPIGLLSSSTLPENIQDYSLPKIPYCKVLSDRIVVYSLNEGNICKKRKNDNSLLNLTKKQYTGKMSINTSSKIRTILDTWLSALLLKIKDESYINCKKLNYPVFITLTLSAPQVYSDKFINRHLLARFLEKYIYHTGCKYLFWRAESQQNGNIHYHIIADKWMDYKKVRKLWNDIQENYGYIDEFEKKYKHRDPNSTDIKGARDVKDFVKYVLKYVAKVDKYRVLECRLWGMSDELRNVKPCVLNPDSEINETFKKIVVSSGSRLIKSEFVDVLLFKYNVVKLFSKSSIFIEYKKHLRHIYEVLYNNPIEIRHIGNEVNNITVEVEHFERVEQLSLFHDKDFDNREIFMEYIGY
jgi:hypothetical protein